MPARIDHVIIAALDLDQLEQTFTRLGFHVTGGGTHPHLGTRNRIIILGDGYIELLAIADAARVSAALLDRISLGGGWVGYPLQSDDIVAEAEAMRRRGVDVRGPTPGRLIAPDGHARSWQVVTVGADDLWAACLPIPFLIQHDSAGERHQRELAGAGGLAPHANGATSLLGVTLRVANVVDLAARYEQTYGLTPTLPHEPEAGRGAITYPLAHAEQRITLALPDIPAADEDSRTRAAIVMSVEVRAPDLALAERAARQAGFAATRLPNALNVSLPHNTARIAFSAPT